MTTEAPDRSLRVNTVLERTGLTRSTLYRKTERREFPRRVKIAEHCTGWRESAVTEWLRKPYVEPQKETHFVAAEPTRCAALWISKRLSFQLLP